MAGHRGMGGRSLGSPSERPRGPHCLGLPPDHNSRHVWVLRVPAWLPDFARRAFSRHTGRQLCALTQSRAGTAGEGGGRQPAWGPGPSRPLPGCEAVTGHLPLWFPRLENGERTLLPAGVAHTALTVYQALDPRCLALTPT